MESLSTPRSTAGAHDATPTTDFALIESQKENIRPLASGRSAATLGSLVERTEREKVIQEGHERHQKEIEDAERRDAQGGEMAEGIQDVLDVYNRYILFTVQHHPSSARHLLPLLESTTRRFVNDARYAQDVRHLKFWVMYTRHVERREEVWAFLESRDVGTRHALFYEEWAAAAEGLGTKKKADDIYRLGIARKSAPLERLKARHHAFLARIMAPPSGDVPDDEPSVPTQTPSRSVLGHVGSATSSSISGATQLAPANRLSKAPNEAKIQIFSDENGPRQDGTANEWNDFGTRDGRRKENTVEAGPWKGETLPQKKVAPRTPKMEVFKDSNENEAVRLADEVFSRSKQPMNEAELLRSDPLRHYDTSSLSTAVPSLPPLPAPPSARKPPRPKSSSSHFVMQPWECPTDGPEHKDAKGNIQRRMFDWDNVFKGGEEWSFEEVRVRQRGLLGKEKKGEIGDWERAWHRPGSTTPKEERKVKPPSPTMNTKLANQEVAMMFDQTIHGGKIRDSSDDESGSSDEEDLDAPLPIAPTPLPDPSDMLRPTAGMVPPTPTPMQGNNPSFRPLSSQDVFADENAVPPSASKPAKFNIFAETPAKRLASRTPLGLSSASKPKAFEIHQEQPAVTVAATPAPKSRQPLGSANSFATPAVSERVIDRRALAQAIPQEPEEAEAEGDDTDHLLSQVIDEHFENIDEEDDGDEPPMRRRGGRFDVNEMTPIAERTCEFTQMTTLRSSQFGTNTTSRRTSVATSMNTVNEEGNEAFLASDPVSALAGLSAVVEDDERSGSNRSTRSVFDTSPQNGDRSGSVGSGFHLPEGFTIHGQGGANTTSANTMVIVDGQDTMHTARESSPDATDTDAFHTAQHSVGLPNPCNPSDEDVLATLLSVIDPPLSALHGFADHRNRSFSKLDALQKHCKSKVRRSSTSASASRASIAPEAGYALNLVSKGYEIRDKIGEGGYGAVFLAVDVDARQAQDEVDSDDEDEDEEGEDKCLVAIKVEKPTAVWEAVVLDRLHRRLDDRLRASMVRPRNLYAFADESYLLLDYSAQGTLLDVVNKATTMGIAPATTGGQSTLDELVAIFFTIELLRVVEGLHESNFIHGDLKIDNCLVRLDDIPNSKWSTQYTRTGSDGWSHKGVKLIDFGRSIDLSLFPNNGAGQTFIADWPTDERDCVEMRRGRPWSYQTDYFGLASVCYCMLFGKYIGMENVAGDSEQYRIDAPLKRYWQSELWTPLFDTLLNPTLVRSDGQLPITMELREIRERFEQWLEENCQKGGKSLRSMLKKIELAALTGRRP